MSRLIPRFSLVGRCVWMFHHNLFSTSVVLNQNNVREADFLQSTNSIATPSSLLVMKNRFTTFDQVDHPKVGKAIKIAEYHLNGDREADLIFTQKEAKSLCEILEEILQERHHNDQLPTEQTLEIDVAKLKLAKRKMNPGLEVIEVRQSTPIFKERLPLTIPLDNLKEFLEQLNFFARNG